MNAPSVDTVDRFGSWLIGRVIADARGDDVDSLQIEPSGRFWLGTLVSEDAQLAMDMGERGERLDPSAVGIRVQPDGPGPWSFQVTATFRLWSKDGDEWAKSDRLSVSGQVDVAEWTGNPESTSHLAGDFDRTLEVIVPDGHLGAEIRADLVSYAGVPNLEITLVNTSPEGSKGLDTRFYESQLLVRGLVTTPFELESLPESFRYDRSVPAYGINCGVELLPDGAMVTTDHVVSTQRRPSFWNWRETAPDLTFSSLAADPFPSLVALVDAHGRWGAEHWSDETLARRSEEESWTAEMRRAAKAARAEFEQEHVRLVEGLAAIQQDADLRRAFTLMNRALIHSSRGRYDGWRPFQIGFVLASCAAIRRADPGRAFADVVWFATGGGKTETYLGLVVMSALYDRMTGKSSGVTAWSRFPLRLLSLQQTQRFADALAGAELVRRDEDLGGDPFSVGFFVGEGSTPNRIEEDPSEDWRPDPEDPEMPARYRVLMECPFCFSSDLEMRFDHRSWTLDHCCGNPACPAAGDPLPFRVVDDEIYRFLPTVIVGTLDKIASVSMQASMAGFFGPPRGICVAPDHGHVYAPRSTKPRGCLVPGCDRDKVDLPQPADRYGPSLRLQDELHLLRDSLGAVDAHYEALIDHLQVSASGARAKILGSSATLSGFEHQTDVLYRREGRVFPVPGPSGASGFWTAESDDVARRHVALAPRGATLEFANDRIVTILQQATRRLRDEPEAICTEAGVDPASAPELLSLFGVNVVYGNTIRDLDAASRSLETQIPVEGPLNTASLTGHTDFDEVRRTLARLEDPESDFDERIHVVTASSMMSHGVDIDRLNLMVVLGLPLTTAEYIQTTARVGRRWPGAVFVLHKMARERDASTFRAWDQFVRQGDRFVEPIPITRRSRRVLQRTAPGLLLGRLLHHHEPRSSKALTTAKALRQYRAQGRFDEVTEFEALVEMLGLDGPLDGPMIEALRSWVAGYFENLEDTSIDARFPREFCPGGDGPMRSLRDVEEQAPVRDLVMGGD